MTTDATTDAVAERPAPAAPAPKPHARQGLFGMGWAGLSQGTCLAIRFGNNVILAYLLAPGIFGVFSAALAILSMLELLCDLGIQPALIRHPKGGRPEYLLTGWSMNLVRFAGVSALIPALAYPFAWFNHKPLLFPVLLALAPWPLLRGLRSPGWPLVRRDINFRAVFVDEVAQTVVQTIVSIALAWAFHSVWSIVVGSMAGLIAGLVVTYVICPMRPRLIWDREALGAIGHLSTQIIFNTMAMVLWMNIDRIIGLRYVGEIEMGYYATAIALVRAAEQLIVRACDVYFTILSRYADLEARDAFHRKVNRLTAMVGSAVLAVGVLAAPYIIGLLYDARYAGAKVPFTILTARLMLYGLGILQFQYLLSLAEVRLNTRALLAALVVEIVLLVPLARAWGASGMALCLLISTVVHLGLQSLLLHLKGLGSIYPFLIASACAALSLVSLAW